MRKRDVPQDKGIITDGLSEVCYAVDDDGRYTLAPSIGWDVKTTANNQAWEVIREEVLDTVRRIEAGELSPLAFHMVRNQMEPRLLAQYVGMFTFRVKRHLRAGPFGKLSREMLERYAAVFGFTVDDLARFPTEDQLDAEFPAPGGSE